jgi:hypothetical protein
VYAVYGYLCRVHSPGKVPKPQVKPRKKPGLQISFEGEIGMKNPYFCAPSILVVYINEAPLHIAGLRICAQV